MREIMERRSAAVARALIVSTALSLFLTGCGHHPKTAVQREHGTFVMDDFESGALTGWKAVGAGSGRLVRLHRWQQVTGSFSERSQRSV